MTKATPLNVNILYNRSNPYGLATDAQVLEELLRLQTAVPIGQIHHVDPREPPRTADVQFHLEVPVFGNCPWSAANVLLVNPEHYVAAAYDAYLHAFNAVITRTEERVAGSSYVHWCLPAKKHAELAAAAAKRTEQQKDLGFLALIGGSTNKAAALAELLPNWLPGSPKLRVYTSRSDLAGQLEGVRAVDAPVEIICKELSADEVVRLQKLYSGHLVVSRAEGFGYAAAEGAAAGAFLILSDIPAFQRFKGQSATAFVSATAQQQQQEQLADAFREFGLFAASTSSSASAQQQLQLAVADLTSLLKSLEQKVQSSRTPGSAQLQLQLPPILSPDAALCPPITVVTLTRNRRNFIDLACLNLLLTDYPRDKIEWLVVEDSDDDEKSASDKVIGFAAKNPDIKVSYIPLIGRTSIGEKRNKAVERAMHDIILFMDDDDVYPATSFRRRVAWLEKGSLSTKPACVASTMLAMYNLRTGQSAVNVPPFNIPLGQRVSEATLTFHKHFWVERPFADVSIAEGEDWLAGREGVVLEIPPQQIIVALTHGDNISSRAIPADARVGCFWGWDEAMLRFLHGLVGVKVEAEGGN
jgi:hypothetical protein